MEPSAARRFEIKCVKPVKPFVSQTRDTNGFFVANEQPTPTLISFWSIMRAT